MAALTSSELASRIINWSALKGVTADDDNMKMVAGMTLAFVSDLPVAQPVAGETPAQVASRETRVEAGAVMLGARLWRRRNSPGGIEQATDAGVAYVARHDADVSRMLKLDGYAAPAVG